MTLFCFAFLCVHSSFAIILKRKRKLVPLLLLSYRCIVSINVMWLFLTVPWVGLQCVIVVFPDITDFLLCKVLSEKWRFSGRPVMSLRCMLAWLFVIFQGDREKYC